MAQLKAIFLGRSGLQEYRKLARLNNIQLDVFTNKPDAYKLFSKYDFAFVSGYLSILEALKAKTGVFAYYDNQVKKDYLEMTPFAQYITIFNDPRTVEVDIDKTKITAGKKWVDTQTWTKLAHIYEKLYETK